MLIKFFQKALWGFRWLFWKLRLEHLGRGCKFYNGVIIRSPQHVSIASNCAIGDYVVIWGGGKVTIGNNVLIAAHSVIASVTHDTNAVIFRESVKRLPVIIQDNVWIGAGVTILPGVTIHANTVIGAGSVVTKDVPENTIAIGVPARQIVRKNHQANVNL